MTALLTLLMALAVGAAISLLVTYSIAHGREVIASIFRLGAPDDWPRGVQEEEPRAWRFPEDWGARR